MGPLLEVGIMAFNTESLSMVSALKGRVLSQKLMKMGILDEMEAIALEKAFAQGRYDEAHTLLVQAQERDSAQ